MLWLSLVLGLFAVAWKPYTIMGTQDIFHPGLGVKFTQMGYLTPASSHYVYTIKVQQIAHFDKYYFASHYYTCNYTFGESFARHVPVEYREEFCQATEHWRQIIQAKVRTVAQQVKSYKNNFSILFRDRTNELKRGQVRRARFLSLLTGVASLISGIADGYEKFVMAKQIKHLGHNINKLFSNDQKLLQHLERTQTQNKQMFQNLHQRVYRLRAQSEQLRSAVKDLTSSASNATKVINVLHYTMQLMNYVYTVKLPALETIRQEIELRMESLAMLARGFITPALIPPSFLENILVEAENQLQNISAKLAYSDMAHYYTTRIAVAQRAGQELFVTLFLPMVPDSRSGTYHLYRIDTFPIPIDQSFKTNVSTRVVGLPAYIAELGEEIFQLDHGQLQTCMADSHFWNCPSDLPMLRSTTCATALFQQNHNEILSNCKFELNPLLEESIAREMEPGQYLISTSFQNWTIDCPGQEIVELQSCQFCTVKLNCACKLHTQDFSIGGTFDNCLEDHVHQHEIEYGRNIRYLYYVEPEKFFNSDVWQLQPAPLHPKFKETELQNENIQNIENKWIDLEEKGKMIARDEVLEFNPPATAQSTGMAMNFIIAISGISISAIMILLAIFISGLLKRKATTWKNQFLEAGAVLTALPIGTNAENTTIVVPNIFDIISTSALTLLLLGGLVYLLFKIIRYWYQHYGNSVYSHVFKYQNNLPDVTVMLEMYTANSYALIPLTSYKLTPDRLLITYQPCDVTVVKKGQWWMSHLEIQYGQTKIHVDEIQTNLGLPQRVDLP